MKKLILIYTTLLCTIVANGQTQFQALSLNDACEKAKTEGKMVFVDLYTSWCAPCKMMAKEIFPNPQLGEFMNQHFVCVKYDTGTEDDGKMLVEKFSVQAYPTFLLLNTDQDLENQIVGATADPAEFMKLVQESIQTSLVRLNEQYSNGNRDVSFLNNYLQEILKASLEEQAKEVCTELFRVLPDSEKSNPAYWYIYCNQMLSPIGSETMDFLFSHFKQFTRNVGEEKVLIRISEAFEIKLRDMIRGRETMDDLDKVVKQMTPHHFNSRERMDVYVALAKALRRAMKSKQTKDIERLLALCETEFPQIDGEHLVYFYFPVTIYIANQGNNAQCERVCRLHEYIYEHTTHMPLKIGLGNMLAGSEKNKKN